MTHAWVRDGKIYFILPTEHEPETMGQIFELTWFEDETLCELRELARKARVTADTFERRLAAKLVKEQEITE